MPAIAANLAACIPTLRAEPLGFRPVLAVGFRETMSWAGRRHATQGHDLMRGDGVGGHAGPQPRGAGDPGADRAVGHRRRQGRRRHRSHPCARSEDHASEHGPCPLQGGRGSHSRQRQRRPHQPDHRAGCTLRAGRRGPAKARAGHDHQEPSRARPACGCSQARHLQPRHGQHEYGASRLRQHAASPRSDGAGDPRCRRACRNSKCSRPAICCWPSA